ncbi:hypothetical protein [Psychromonas aquimarina]|uniref:hypothetical protein n=1 Tax=Psychromonas aquimarina TaxID=444919 RepID=UPI0004293F5E|nr:hypothetical protein [Psychromonas aquimarina]
MKLPSLLLSLVMISGYAHSQEVSISTFIGDDPTTDISINIMQEAYQRIGVSMKVLPQPAERSLRTSNYGGSDGELFRIKAIEKEFVNLIRVPVAIARIDMVAFAKAGKGISINGWDSLASYLVSYNRGVKIVEYKVDSKNLIPSKSVLNAVKMLHEDRVDIVIDSRINILKVIKDMGYKEMVALDPPLETIFGYHYIYRNNGHLLTPLLEVLKDMEAKGIIRSYQDKELQKYQD